MKSLAELEAIRQKTLENIAMRKEVHDSARVVVGMATCGIAAGARPVMLGLCGRDQQAQACDHVTGSPDGLRGHVPPGAHGGGLHARSRRR